MVKECFQNDLSGSSVQNELVEEEMDGDKTIRSQVQSIQKEQARLRQDSEKEEGRFSRKVKVILTKKWRA